MKDSLVRCSTCKRHIYASESACPFCTRQSNASPTVLAAAALTAGLAIAGCGGEQPQSRQPADVAAPDVQPTDPKQIAEDPPPPPPPGPTVSPAPAYGGPPPVVGPVGPPVAAYGAPPPMPGPQKPPR